MKNNFILGTVFCILVAIAYYYEEMEKPINDKIIQLEQGHIIGDKTKITELKTNHFHLIKKKNEWMLKDSLWKVDQLKVISFIEALSALRITGSMAASERLKWDISEEVNLRIHGKVEKITLLGVSKVTGSLYFSRSQNTGIISIVQDEKAYEDIYQNDLDLGLRKYARLIKVFKQGAESFLDLNLLNAMGLNKILYVKVENTRQRPFELHIKDKQTKPNILNPLKTKNLLNRFTELMSIKRIVRIIGKGKNILTDKRSVVLVEGDSTERIVEYYLGLNGRYGHYLKIQGMDSLYEVELYDKNIFTVGIEDFWEKKFVHNNSIDFQQLKKLDFEIKYKNEYYPFYVNNFQQFKIMSDDDRIEFIDRTRMNFLFNLLFNLTEFKEAIYVENILDKTFLTNSLHIKMFDNLYIVKLKTQEIIVDDTKNQLRFYFTNKSGKVDTTFFEKIFTVKNK